MRAPLSACLLLAACPLALGAGPARAEAAPSPYDRAVQDRLAGRTRQAIAALRALAESTPQDADVWLNLGLAYTQARDYAAAETALARGLQVAPDYADLRVAYARLAFFRGRNGEARRRLGPALAQAPTPDAKALLDQIAAAEQAARAAAWRVDAAMTYSSLSNGLQPWREWDLAAGRRLGPDASVSLGLEQTSRFGLSDTYLHGEYARRLGGAGLFVGLGGAPDASYRARALVQAGVSAPPLRLGGGWRLDGELGGFWARYPDGEVASIQPQLTLAQGDRLSLAGRYVRTRDERGRTLEGYALRGQAALAPRLRLDLGYAFAPESSSGVTVQAKTVSAGLAFDIDRATTVRLGGAYADQKAYVRRDLGLNVTRRF